MDAFINCPQCGRIDNRRTSCVCGYALKPVPPVNPPAVDRGQPEAQAGPESPNLKRGLIVLVGVVGCGILLTIFWPKPRTFSSGVEDIRKQFDDIKQMKVLERERSEQKLTELLQRVHNEETARAALFQCFLKGGEVARLGLLEFHFESTRDILPSKVGEDLRKREKLSEVSEAFIAEIKKVAAKYPRAVQSATESFMPKGIKPPQPVSQPIRRTELPKEQEQLGERCQ